MQCARVGREAPQQPAGLPGRRDAQLSELGIKLAAAGHPSSTRTHLAFIPVRVCQAFHEDPTHPSLTALRRRLLRWYRESGREFPWRGTRDPWAVLLAELMLQRTRADLVVAVYDEAMRRYPSAAAFADAPPKEIADLLRPLGYKHRNKRLQAAAAACREGVPRTMTGLLGVPGVGRYAARATLCFAYGRRLGVVDPSVIRVLDRLDIARSSRVRPREDGELWKAADRLLPARNSRTWNYAVLDLGAVVCRPKPRCPACPLLPLCPTGAAHIAARVD